MAKGSIDGLERRCANQSDFRLELTWVGGGAKGPNPLSCQNDRMPMTHMGMTSGAFSEIRLRSLFGISMK